MVREERALPDDNIAALSNDRMSRDESSELVEKWLHDIRARLPEGAVLSATIRHRPRGGYFASFRLRGEGEMLSSEAKGESMEEAVKKAGLGLSQHLPSSKPADGGMELAG